MLRAAGVGADLRARDEHPGGGPRGAHTGAGANPTVTAPAHATLPRAALADSAPVDGVEVLVAQPGEKRSVWPTVFSALHLVVLSVGIVLVFGPGHMSQDSLVMMQQAIDGEFTDYHTPVLVSLWWAAWRIVGGPWYVFAAGVVTTVVAVHTLLRTTLGRIAAGVSTWAIVLAPTTLGFLAVLSRDVWFGALALAGFGCCVLAATAEGRGRRWWTIAALAAAFLALAARQNAAPAVLVLVWVALPGVIDRLRPDDGSRWRLSKRGALRFLAAFAAVVIVYAGQQLYTRTVLGVTTAARPYQAVYLYDLIQLSERSGELLLPPEVYPGQDLQALVERASVGSIDGVLFADPILVPFPLSDAGIAQAGDVWRDAVFDDPLEYLAMRWDLSAGPDRMGPRRRLDPTPVCRCELVGLCTGEPRSRRRSGRLRRMVRARPQWRRRPGVRRLVLPVGVRGGGRLLSPPQRGRRPPCARQPRGGGSRLRGNLLLRGDGQPVPVQLVRGRHGSRGGHLRRGRRHPRRRDAPGVSMIITRTPLRISIGGGGTDLPSYYSRYGGFLIAGAIDKYLYIAINATFTSDYFLKYSDIERVSTSTT